uniref:Uncharacterized protein n=1 Tax=Anguilla anguilla TaxID=7936 RepID=A0A0E9P9U3_ANGAN
MAHLRLRPAIIRPRMVNVFTDSATSDAQNLVHPP